MTQRTEHTVIISTSTYRKLCALANQYGWTPGGREGTTYRAIEMVEEALNVRVEELDRMTNEAAQKDAEIERLRAALVSVHDMARLGRKDAIAALELIELNSHKALTGE